MRIWLRTLCTAGMTREMILGSVPPECSEKSIIYPLTECDNRESFGAALALVINQINVCELALSRHPASWYRVKTEPRLVLVPGNPFQASGDELNGLYFILAITLLWYEVPESMWHSSALYARGYIAITWALEELIRTLNAIDLSILTMTYGLVEAGCCTKWKPFC